MQLDFAEHHAGRNCGLCLGRGLLTIVVAMAC